MLAFLLILSNLEIRYNYKPNHYVEKDRRFLS